MHSALPFLILLATLSAATAPAAEPPQPPASLDDAFRIVAQVVAKDEIPGAVALVTQHGKVLGESAFGLSDLDNRIPFRPDTICWLASITKPVTVAAAMTLVDAGKLSLDDTVEKFLPEFKNQRASDGLHHPVNIRQLMTHTSGIQPGPPLRPKFFFEPEWLSQNLPAVVHEIALTNLQFMPGAKVQYSNAAPYVLARIIELLSGKPFHTYVEDALLRRLDMNDTFFILPPSVSPRLAVVYRTDKTTAKRLIFFRFDPTWKITMTMPDGGLFSTARDVSKFIRMFLDDDGSVLSKSSVHQMLTEQAPGWGLGWELFADGAFGHTGSSGTAAWGYPKTGTCAILFSQSQDKDRVDPLQAHFREAVRTVVNQPAR